MPTTPSHQAPPPGAELTRQDLIEIVEALLAQASRIEAILTGHEAAPDREQIVRALEDARRQVDAARSLLPAA